MMSYDVKGQRQNNHFIPKLRFCAKHPEALKLSGQHWDHFWSGLSISINQREHCMHEITSFFIELPPPSSPNISTYECTKPNSVSPHIFLSSLWSNSEELIAWGGLNRKKCRWSTSQGKTRWYCKSALLQSHSAPWLPATRQSLVKCTLEALANLLSMNNAFCKGPSAVFQSSKAMGKGRHSSGSQLTTRRLHTSNHP